MNTVFDCSLLKLPKIKNRAGNITVVDYGENTVRFEVRRVYYLYDVPRTEDRGAHAFKEQQ